MILVDWIHQSTQRRHVRQKENSTMSIQANGVTSSTNPRATIKTGLKTSTSLANENGHLKLSDAIETFFDWGSNMAGVDGNIVRALKFWGTDSKEDKAARSELWKAMNYGYLVRKLGYTRDYAAVVFDRMKYNSKNPDKNTDDHRTAEEQRVIDTCRQMKSRAMALAGISDMSEKQRQSLEDAAATRKEKKDKAEARESELLKDHEIIHPSDETDPIEALTRVALTLKSLQKRYALRLTGDLGSAWRNWIDDAPMGNKAPKTSSKKK